MERTNEEDQGAGDQGMMFGYATNETENYMPLALQLSHMLLIELAKLRREDDAKSSGRVETRNSGTFQR